MQLYRLWLHLCNFSAVLDTRLPWLCMSGLHRFARVWSLQVKWNQASEETALRDAAGWSWINAPKLESAVRLEQANVSPLTVVSWEAINDSRSRNPGSDPRITLIVSAPWPARRIWAPVCSLQLMSLNSHE